MKTFSIKEAIKHGWELFKTHKKALVIPFIIIAVVQNLGGFLSDNASPVAEGVISLVLWIVGMWLQIGIQKLVLSIEDGGAPEWKEIFNHGKLLIKYTVTTILYGLGVFIGLLLLIVPGIYFAVKYSFAVINVADKDMGIMDAFKLSAKLTEGVKRKLLLFFLAMLGIIILGLIALVVGIFVAGPVVCIAYAHVYRILEKGTSVTSPVAL